MPERLLIKRATNILWNVSSRRKAERATTKLLADHDEASFLRNVIFSVEDLNVADFVSRIVKAHPALKGQFFSEVGLDLMRLDGSIMLDTLHDFVVEAGRPALGIHDSIVCKATDWKLARKIMRKNYRRYLRRDPVIKRVY